MKKRHLEIVPRPRKKCEMCNSIMPRNHTRYCSIVCSRKGQHKRQQALRIASDERKRNGFGQTMEIQVGKKERDYNGEY